MTLGRSPHAFTSAMSKDTLVNQWVMRNRTAGCPPAPACLTATRAEAMRKPTKSGAARSSTPSASRTKSRRRQKKSCGWSTTASWQFHEIGVVARGLESYGTVIRDCFAQHRIPLAGRLEEPLVLLPLTKAVILLLNLPAKDFLRSQVIDLLSSALFPIAQTRS